VSRRMHVLASVVLVLFTVVAAQAAWIQYFHASALDASTSIRATTSAILSTNGVRSLPPTAPSWPSRCRRRVPRILGGASTRRANSSPASSDSRPACTPSGDWRRSTTPPSRRTPSRPELGAGPRAHRGRRLGDPDARAQVAEDRSVSPRRARRLVVALDPKTGDVLAMYSNPTYSPRRSRRPARACRRPRGSWEHEGQGGICAAGPAGDPSDVLPGLDLQGHHDGGDSQVPAVADEQYYTPMVYTALPDTNKLLYNDGDSSCGGPCSRCCPPRATRATRCWAWPWVQGPERRGQRLRLQRGPAAGPARRGAVVLPGGVQPRGQPALPRLLGHCQEDVSATALENALVAAGVANGAPS